MCYQKRFEDGPKIIKGNFVTFGMNSNLLNWLLLTLCKLTMVLSEYH